MGENKIKLYSINIGIILTILKDRITLSLNPR